MASKPALTTIATTDVLNGGKPSLLKSGAAEHNRKASIIPCTITTPDENHSQLSSTPTGTTTAVTLIPDTQKSSDESGYIALSADTADTTDPTPFEQKPSVLASLVDPKSLRSLEAMGGTEGLLRRLDADANPGLKSWQYAESSQRHDLEKGKGGGAGAGSDSFQSHATADDRRRMYGGNQMSSRKSKSLLVFLSVAAVIEFALGLHFGSDTPPAGGLCDDGVDKCAALPVDWVEGAAIMTAVLLIIIVASFGDWQQETQFRELDGGEDDRGVKVIRDGQEQVINVKDATV